MLNDYGRPKDTSAQGIFNKVVRHLRKQGRRATTRTFWGLNCCYRDGQGGACAVGCLLTDKEAKEGGTREWGRLLSHELAPDLDAHYPLLVRLQTAHDLFADTPSELEGALADVAVEFGLYLEAPGA